MGRFTPRAAVVWMLSLAALAMAPAAASGALNFKPAANFTAGEDPYSVAIGDLNNDGRPDLAVANTYSDNVSVLLGTGSGSFGAATSFPAGDDPTSVTIGDINNDGRTDLAAANYSSNNVSVLLGNGSGSFGAANNFPAGNGPQAVAIGDLNNDGRPDLVVADYSSNNVSVLLGTGSGSFGAATNFPAGDGPFSVAIGDINNDGRPDLAAANSNSDNVSVLLGTGTGSFGAATNFPAGDSPHSVAIGDLNNDGRPDLAVANYISDNVSVLINAPTASVSPSSLVFGSPTPVPQGMVSAPQTATITNNGSAPLEVTGFTFSGTNPDDFFVGSETCDGNIPEGSSCQVRVRFAPQATGARSGILTALTNAAANPTVTLTGTAGPLPVGPTGPTGPTGPQGPGSGKSPRFSRLTNAPIRVTAKRRIRVVRVTCPEGRCRIRKSKASFNVGGSVFSGRSVFPTGLFPAGSSRVISVPVPRRVFRMLANRSGRVAVTVLATSTNGTTNQGLLRGPIRR